MNSRVLVLLICISSCVLKDSNEEYISSVHDESNRLHVIQYHKFPDSENKGIYFTTDNGVGIPDSNFVFVKYSEFPFYVKWENDSVFLRFPAWTIINSELSNSKINLSRDFTSIEKSKFGYDVDRKEFYKKIESEYESFDVNDLEGNW